MDHYDEQFEKYLLEFQPRRPRALPSMATANAQWRRFAAAATIFLTVGAAGWFARHEKQPDVTPGVRLQAQDAFNTRPAALSLETLTKLAVDRPEELDAALTEASPRVLPDFRGKESTLRVLTKE